MPSAERVLSTYGRIRSWLYTFAIRGLLDSSGRKLSVGPPLRFANLSLVKVGDNVTIHAHCWIHALRLADDDGRPKIVLGNGVAIGMGATISAARRIEIGDNVFTARNVYISDHGHEFRDPSRPISLQGIGDVDSVAIGANTWIGQNAVILPGVRIGRNCVIGANAVVNQNVPDYCVAAGVPAKVIRRYDAATGKWERASR